MEYFTLTMGIILTAVFTWLLLRNGRRSGFITAWFRIDTLLGMIAGIYLVISSFSTIIH